MLEISMVRSMAGLLPGGRLSAHRPFRNPHHSASQAAIIGGGLRAQPGEVSLAHRGVLFLDELPEFPPRVLEALRQPLESGTAVIARANHHVTYPARFQMVAAMNPCQCGYAGEPGHCCARGAQCATRYQARLSGPLLDRIDMTIDLPSVDARDLMRPAGGESSAAVAARVAEARALQRERYGDLGHPEVTANAEAPAAVIETCAQPDSGGTTLLGDAADRLGLSARAFYRVLRTARTLADLDGASSVRRQHIAEALSHRRSETLASAA